MTKIRRQKKRKVYHYDVNRKRARNKLKKLPKITCEPIKEEWNKKKSVKANLVGMGLAYDPNDTIKITRKKDEANVAEKNAVQSNVPMELEADAKAPRERKFRLPNSQVFWLTKLLDTYGEDYQAMAKDPKLNAFQETWKQLRQKIKRFKGIPEQYGEYLKKKEEEANKA